jgi:ubiquinone/menaquinone biosynthesis C-methylase UbiE
MPESRDIGSAKYNAASFVRPACVSVEEGYERWAPTYDQTPNPLLNLEERNLATLLPDLRDKRILDLACGTGRWLEKLSVQATGLGVGVDFSASMLRIADKKTAIRGRLARGDCQSLPFHASTFDLVVCSFALGHIPDLGPLVRELERVTMPGADVLVSDLHSEAYARGWRTGFRDSRSAIEIDMWPRTDEEIVRCFHSAGFECLTRITLRFGEPEKPIFDRAGKSDLFTAARQVPAVLICHFRLDPAETRSRGEP